MKLDDELVKEAHVLLHPIRFRIVELLEEQPMHINAISKALEEKKKKLVSYHLGILEDHGFVRSKYEISEQPKSKGKALKRYWVTDKVNEVVGELKKM
ncbi:MAG: ArsR/SmtB family transcription factor [Candidatus Methanospirareceae archaeon]